MTDLYQPQTKRYIFNTYGRYPITLVKGEGAYVWDANHKKYLDFLTGIACTPLGHAHPKITEAIMQQVTQILHTSNLYHSPPSIALAEFLIQHGGLDKIFFCNSGSEANEMAIKLARKYQKMQGHPHQFVILSATHSFHGRTLGALAATAKPKIQAGFEPLPRGFRYADWRDTAAFCQQINSEVAAVILEPVQGEGGMHVAPPGFLSAVRERCNKTGALLILDEVQCGVGRTGKLFAYENFHIKPDIITLAKGIANGLPLGVVCATTQVANALSPGDHGSTFGGNPVSCSAALATLQMIIEQNYLPRVQKLGAYLRQQLMQLQTQFPHFIRVVRGMGLMLGMELSQQPQAILTACQDAGLLLNITADNVLRFLPPYIMTEKEIDQAVTILQAVFGKMETQLQDENNG